MSNNSNADVLLDAIGLINDDLVAEAAGRAVVSGIPSKLKLNLMVMRKLMAATLCLAIVSALIPMSAYLYNNFLQPSGLPSGTTEGESTPYESESTPSQTEESTEPTETTEPEDITTSVPVPETEPMKFEEHITICATTEFPMIATIGGEKVDVTMRAAALRGAFDIHFIYIDAVLDGKIIFSQRFRAIGQVMATTEKTEYFALLKILDSAHSINADATFVTYSLTDAAKGKLELVCVDGFSATLNVPLNIEDSQPIRHASQHGYFRSFTRQIKLEEFESKYAPLCMVLDSVSDPDNEISASPSDKLPIYNVEDFSDHRFFVEKKAAYDNYYNLTQPLRSFNTLAPMIPEGTKIDYNSAKCTSDVLTIDGVNYKKIYRSFTILDAQGNACGQYSDYVSYYDLTILSYEITQ